MKFTGFRTDTEEYFKLSGIRESKTLNHHPFVVFDGDEVMIVNNARDLLKFPDDTNVIAQWGGKWSSNFFHFKVGDFKLHTIVNPKESYQIV